MTVDAAYCAAISHPMFSADCLYHAIGSAAKDSTILVTPGRWTNTTLPYQVLVDGVTIQSAPPTASDQMAILDADGGEPVLYSEGRFLPARPFDAETFLHPPPFPCAFSPMTPRAVAFAGMQIGAADVTLRSMVFTGWSSRFGGGIVLSSSATGTNLESVVVTANNAVTLVPQVCNPVYGCTSSAHGLGGGIAINSGATAIISNSLYVPISAC